MARVGALLAQQDPRLAHLIKAWSGLSDAMRDAIAALVNAANGREDIAHQIVSPVSECPDNKEKTP